MSVKVTCKYKKDPIKTAEKKWQHRFPHYKSMGYFSDAQGQLTPQSVVGSGRTSNPPSFQACPRYLQYKKDLWELSVAMEIRLPIRSGPKPNAAFPLPQ